VRRKPEKLDRDTARALIKKVRQDPPFPGMTPHETTAFEQSACQHCGGLHARNCPAVEEVEYHTDGKVKRVRFRAWFDDSRVLWLDDVIEAAQLDQAD